MEAVKAVKGHYLFNMLQDFRHVLVFDLREKSEWESNHIRDSFNVNAQTPKPEVEKVIEASLRQADEKEQKYKQLKKVRRYFFIGGKSPQEQERMGRVVAAVPASSDNKIYSLAEDFSQFHK